MVNKRGQFFILSAVIIASVIVSLATVQNYVVTGDTPAKFYYYSNQLQQETGAVVNYVLLNENSGGKVGEFLQEGIKKTKESYPDIEIYACYTGQDQSTIYCQNNGTQTITVWSSCDLDYRVSLAPIQSASSSNGRAMRHSSPSGNEFGINCLGAKLNFNVSGNVYTVDLSNTTISNSQFYFQFLLNTSSGSSTVNSDLPRGPLASPSILGE